MAKYMIFLFVVSTAKCVSACDLSFDFEFCANVLSNPCYSFRLGKFSMQEGHFSKQIKKGIVFKGTIEDCNGVLNFELIDSTNDLIIKGNFVEGLDTLKEQVMVEDPASGETKIVVIKYFSPLKNGEWEYFHVDGSFIKKELFRFGIEAR